MNLRKYESIYVLHPNLTEEAQKRVNNKIHSIITGDDGKILEVNNWGTRRTAYLVRKQGKGHYIQLTFAGNPGVVAKLERNYRITDEVMKFHNLKVADEVSAEELEQEIVYKQKLEEEKPYGKDRKDGRRGNFNRNRDDRRDDRREDRSEKSDKSEKAEKAEKAENVEEKSSEEAPAATEE